MVYKLTGRIDSNNAAQLEEELGLVRVEMHNLSSLTETEESMGKDYISLMYENLSVLDTMRKDIVSLQN